MNLNKINMFFVSLAWLGWVAPVVAVDTPSWVVRGLPLEPAVPQERRGVETCLGDWDDDGDVDATDFTYMAVCMSAPGSTPAPTPPATVLECLAAFDFDVDGDVDLRDWSAFQRVFDRPCNPSTCGNGMLDEGETCDPPTPGYCDDSCRLVCGPGTGSCSINNGTPGCDDEYCCTTVCAGDPYCCMTMWDARCAGEVGDSCELIPDNDSCDTPDIATDGLTEFYTFGATGDLSDVWFTYTATCTGYATVSLCGSDYDTVLDVFDTNGCTSELPVATSDDDCGTGLQSRVNMPVGAGDVYTLRVGGYLGATGEAWLTLQCSGDAGFANCGSGTGACDAPHDGAGCDDIACCESVCATDAYCCDIAWDQACAEETAGECAP